MPSATAIPTLKLNPPQIGFIRNGGYVISYTGTIPPGIKLWLGLPDLNNAMEVSGRNRTNIIDRNNMATFLALIRKKQTWWGGTGKCRLFAKQGESIIAQSNIEEFPCPVQPFAGCLSPDFGKGDSGPKLRYTGTPPKYPDGRVLRIPAIDGYYYFAYAGKFETDDKWRGFNCITYVGSVFGVDANSGAMSAYGTQLANHCGCAPVGCENETLQKVKTFFKSHREGTYIMWSAIHTVIVFKGIVYEFRKPRGGYNMQDINEWEHESKRWWVRRSVKQF